MTFAARNRRTSDPCYARAMHRHSARCRSRLPFAPTPLSVPGNVPLAVADLLSARRSASCRFKFWPAGHLPIGAEDHRPLKHPNGQPQTMDNITSTLVQHTSASVRRPSLIWCNAKQRISRCFEHQCTASGRVVDERAENGLCSRGWLAFLRTACPLAGSSIGCRALPGRTGFEGTTAAARANGTQWELTTFQT